MMRIQAFPAIALALLCIVTYFPTLQSEFKLDDFIFSSKSLHLNLQSAIELFTHSKDQHYHPLNILLIELTFKMWGTNTVIFHIFNLSLFFINGLLLYQLVKALIKVESIALLAASLFCLHPINAEIVNQIIFSSVLLSAVLFQLAILQFDQFIVRQNKTNYFLTFLFSILAALTLETTWILPLYLFMWAYFVRKINFMTAARNTAPFFIIPGVLLLVWQSLSHGNSLSSDLPQKIAYLNLNPLNFIGTIIFLFTWYVQKLFYPVNIIWMYSIAPFDSTASIIAILLLSIIVVALIMAVKRSSFSSQFIFPVLWFLAGFVYLLPCSLAHLENGLIIEPYWFYVASMGFFLFMAVILQRLSEKISAKIFTIFGIILICYLFYFTQIMNFVTRTEKSYSEYWMRISPNPVPLTALAKIASQEKNYRQAITYYEIYLRDFSNSPYASFWPWEVYVSMASVYSDSGDLMAAKYWADKAISANPRDPRAYIVKGGVFVREKNLTQAEESYLKAISVNPENLLAKLNLADLYLLDQKEPQAIPLLSDLAQASLIGNEKINVFAKLAALQYRYGTKSDAQGTIDKLLAQEPEAKSYFILAQAFAYFKIPEQSMRLLKLGLERYPSDNDLNILYRQLGGK